MNLSTSVCKIVLNATCAVKQLMKEEMSRRFSIVILAASLLFPLHNLRAQLVGTVEGIVMAGRTPVKDARIGLIGSGKEAVSDSVGCFCMRNVTPGFYTLRVTANGYITEEVKRVRVDIGERHELKLSLTRDGVDSIAARLDIESGTPRILMHGGMEARILTSDDEDFEDEYGVNYSDFGCTPPLGKQIREYNWVIFKYLDDTFSKEWREEVRSDVWFIQEWSISSK